MRDKLDRCVQREEEILEVFWENYSDLYEGEREIETEKIEGFLAHIVLPSVTRDEWLMLESPITIEEIKTAVKDTMRGKAPGDDRLPLQLFEQFGDILYPELINVYLEAQ